MSETTTDTPELIYPYTNLAGLTGILESGNIWCTNSLFLNDTKECYLTYELSEKYIEDNYYPHAPLSRVESLKRCFKLCHDYFAHSISSSTSIIPYVSSFSKKGDLLSQWRGYC